jgi:ligand-binding sensor domain-containing protein
MAIDRNNNIWLGLNKMGLDYFNRKDNSFSHFYNENKNGRISADINTVYKDKAENIWISNIALGITKLNYDLNKPVSQENLILKSF